MFADIAPSFYQMAEYILQKQIQLVDNSLMEVFLIPLLDIFIVFFMYSWSLLFHFYSIATNFQAIDGADGFQNTHQPQQFELAKFSLEQVSLLFILNISSWRTMVILRIR